MKCVNCHCDCRACREFNLGDRIELSVAGILMLGSRMVSRGTVIGQIRRSGKVTIQVHWDGYSKMIVSAINPTHIQKVYDPERVFI